jgi:anti-sigma B factor antagonist
LKLRELEKAVVITQFSPIRSFAEQKSFLDEIAALVERGRINLIFDLADASYLNTLELGALVSVLKKVKEKGGTLKLIRVQDLIDNLLNLTGLRRVFDTYKSEEEALKSLA